MPTIVHFEIPADNLERAKDFYAELFGWKYQRAESGPIEYWMIETKDEKGEKGLCGGMMGKMQPGHSITNYIDVPSVEEYSAKVEKAGGKVLMPKQVVPSHGYFAVCVDTEGNSFGLWEVDSEAK